MRVCAERVCVIWGRHNREEASEDSLASLPAAVEEEENVISFLARAFFRLRRQDIFFLFISKFSFILVIFRASNALEIVVQSVCFL